MAEGELRVQKLRITISKLICLVCVMTGFCSTLSHAQDILKLSQDKIDESAITITSPELIKSSTLTGYVLQGRVYMPVKATLDALKISYRLVGNRLIVTSDELSNTLVLSSQEVTGLEHAAWFEVAGVRFLSADVMESFLLAKIGLVEDDFSFNTAVAAIEQEQFITPAALSSFQSLCSQLLDGYRLVVKQSFKKAQSDTKVMQQHGLYKARLVTLPFAQRTGYVLSIGGFDTLSEAKRYGRNKGLLSEVHQGLNSDGQLVYRFEYPGFASEQDAIKFARSEFPSLNYKVKKAVVSSTAAVKNWVVQYAAAKDLNEAKNLAKDFAQVAELYIARKKVNGRIWYCLVSKTFYQKSQALGFLKTAKEDGFITQMNQFVDIVWSK